MDFHGRILEEGSQIGTIITRDVRDDGMRLGVGVAGAGRGRAGDDRGRGEVG